MTNFKQSVLIIIAFLSLTSFSQNKRFVEEVAMYHLDSLSRTNANFKNVPYYTKGFLIAAKTSSKDTSGTFSINKTVNMASAFKDLSIVEKEKLSNFPFTENRLKNKNWAPLNIYHFLKAGDLYYVFFDIQRDFENHNILLVMNSKGDLLRYKLHVYKN